MKTRKEIIDETVAYYSEDTSRRAMNVNGYCEYETSDGRMCAVGRCMKKKVRTDLPENCDIQSIRDTYYCALDKAFKKPYRGHSLDFWMDLQALHDYSDYWNKKGLTRKGKIEVQRLHEVYD